MEDQTFALQEKDRIQLLIMALQTFAPALSEAQLLGAIRGIFQSLGIDLPEAETAAPSPLQVV